MSLDDDDLPAGISICSEDLPPPFKAPWFNRPAIEAILASINSGDFAKDDPDALRNAGSAQVARALILQAEAGLTSALVEIRTISRLTLEYFVDQHYRHEMLDAFLGLQRRDGKPSLSIIDSRAERDAILADLARSPRWGNLTPEMAARSMRAELKRYEMTGWTNDRESKTRPQGDWGAWWRILKLGLAYPMPNEKTLADLIDHARSKRPR